MGANETDSAEVRAWQRVAEDGSLVDLTDTRPSAHGLGIAADRLAAIVSEASGLLSAPAKNPALHHHELLSAAQLAVSDYYSRRGIRVEPAQVELLEGSSAGVAGPRTKPRAWAYDGWPEARPLPELKMLDGVALAGLRDSTGTGQRLAFTFVGSAAPPSEVERRALVHASDGGCLWLDEADLDFAAAPERFGRTSFARSRAPQAVVYSDGGRLLGLPWLSAPWRFSAAPSSDGADVVLPASPSLAQAALPKLLELADEAQVELKERLDRNARLVKHRLDGRALGAQFCPGFTLKLTLHAGARPTAIELAADLELRVGLGQRPHELTVSLLSDSEQLEPAIDWLAERSGRLS